MTRAHLDTDCLVFALSGEGPERAVVRGLIDAGAEIEISAVAWYEFCRGPRTGEQLALARSLFDQDGIIALSRDVAERAAEDFVRLGRPRRRAADIAIGATAAARGATLLTRNPRDFRGVADLRVRDATRA